MQSLLFYSNLFLLDLEIWIKFYVISEFIYSFHIECRLIENKTDLHSNNLTNSIWFISLTRFAIGFSFNFRFASPFPIVIRCTWISKTKSIFFCLYKFRHLLLNFLSCRQKKINFDFLFLLHWLRNRFQFVCIESVQHKTKRNHWLQLAHMYGIVRMHTEYDTVCVLFSLSVPHFVSLLFRGMITVSVC